jgi:hypothetical protein
VLYILRYVIEPIAPHTIEKIYNYLFEDGIDIRTIHRKLVPLVDEGLVERKDGKYSLSVKAKSDIRYFAGHFGKNILYLLMSDYEPTKYTIQDNVERLVKLLGMYVLFCFIETAKPVNDIKDHGFNERLISFCLQNIIPIEHLYQYFLAIVDYGLDDGKSNLKSKDDIKSLIQDLSSSNVTASERKDMELLPPISDHFAASDLTIIRFLRKGVLGETQFGSKRIRVGNILDVNEDNLRKLSEAFSKVYPGYFNEMTDFKEQELKGNPKQKVTDFLLT